VVCVCVCRRSWWLCVIPVKKVGSLVQLVEEEKDLINLDKVEEGMVAAVSSLKQSFTTAVVTRLNPSESSGNHQCLTTITKFKLRVLSLAQVL